MTTRRRSLRERNEHAIAGDVDTEPTRAAPVREALPTEPAPTEGSPEAGAARAGQKAARTAPAVAGATNTARVGIYLQPQEFRAAKAAYLADWQHGGTADTFARWIAAALDQHARRSAYDRSAAAPAAPRAATKRGATRSFSLPADTVARMRAAITADHQAGRWPSDSAWCGEAIRAAVEEAREQAGGVLPVPPARLPNRLAR